MLLGQITNGLVIGATHVRLQQGARHWDGTVAHLDGERDIAPRAILEAPGSHR